MGSNSGPERDQGPSRLRWSFHRPVTWSKGKYINQTSYLCQVIYVRVYMHHIFAYAYRVNKFTLMWQLCFKIIKTSKTDKIPSYVPRLFSKIDLRVKLVSKIFFFPPNVMWLGVVEEKKKRDNILTFIRSTMCQVYKISSWYNIY